MVRLLTRADVEDLVDLPTAMDCMERLYRDQGAGQVSAQPPTAMRSDDAMMMVRAGGLAGQHRLGFRISRARGRGWALIWDTPDGELQAVVEYPFSDIRVAGTIAVAADHLAGPDLGDLGIVGTSGIAWASLRGASHVRKARSIRVFSRDPENRQ